MDTNRPKNGIICGTAMAEKRLENSKVRYSAAYPTGRERISNVLLYHGVPIVFHCIRKCVMGNAIIHSNPMMERPSHLSPVKCSAAYSTERERISSMGSHGSPDMA